MSLEAYTALLVEEGLLTPKHQRAWVETYHTLRYKGPQEAPVQWEEALEGIESVLTTWNALEASQQAEKRENFATLAAPPAPIVAPPKNPPQDTVASQAPESQAPTFESPKEAQAAQSPQVSQTTSLHTSPRRGESLLEDMPVVAWGGLCLLCLFMGMGVGISQAELGRVVLWRVGYTFGLTTSAKPPLPAIVRRARSMFYQKQRIRRVYRRLKGRVRARPNDTKLWQQLGRWATRHHHYGQAIYFYKRLLALNPKHASALNELAWLYCVARDHTYRRPKHALRLSQQALALNPQWHVIDTYAEALYKNRQRKRAYEAEQRALKVFQKASASMTDAQRKRGLTHINKQLARFRP